ncbi:MAG TPA: hypothetical protein VFA62_07550 [Acidimicrobiia bacterium]|nr:hypothetical protein [Acidimicrobiia bacterium]
MDVDELTEVLARKGVDRVCPACRTPRLGGTVETDLGSHFVGVYCAHCGCVRLFHQATLEAPE